MNQLSFSYSYMPKESRIQNLAYNYKTSKEYSFLYNRYILSDLDKFNAPIFVSKTEKGAFYCNTSKEYQKEQMHGDISSMDQVKTIEVQKPLTYENYIILTHDGIKEAFEKQESWMSLNSSYGVQISKYKVFDSFNKNIARMKELEAQKTDVNNISLSKIYFSSQNTKSLNQYDVMSISAPIRNLNKIKEINLRKAIDINGIIYKDTFLKRDLMHTNFNQGVSLQKRKINNTSVLKYLDIKNINSIKNINVKQDILLRKSDSINLNVKDDLLLWKYNNIPINITKHFSVERKQKFNLLKQAGSIINRTINGLFKTIGINIKVNQQRNTGYIKTNRFLSTFAIYAFVDKQNTTVSKSGLESRLVKDDIFISHKYTDVFLNDTYKTFIHTRQGFRIEDNTERIVKNRKGFVVNNTEDFITKDRKGIHDLQIAIALNKNKYEFAKKIDWDMDTYKDSKIMEIQNFDDFVITNRLSFTIIDELKKNMYDNSIGTFIKISKHQQKNSLLDKPIVLEKTINKNGNLDNKELPFIKKDKYGFFADTMVTGEKNIHEMVYDYKQALLKKDIKNAILVNNTMSFDKVAYKSNRLYDELFVIKKRKELIYNNKAIVASILGKEITKDNILLRIDITPTAGSILDTQIAYQKQRKGVGFLNELWIHKESKEFEILEDGAFALKELYKVFVNEDNVFIEKKGKLLYDEYKEDEIYLFKEEKELQKPNRNILPLDRLDKELMDTKNETYVWLSKEALETSVIANQIEAMKETIRNLEKPVVKEFNWAWVYQYEDPISGNKDYHGLDELLLPKQDIEYEDFIDIIFDKNRMMPKAPVKVIDETTFIAKYPIKHPLPDYSEVGIDYIDVPSELMRELFLKYYQIWYSNIFKFGNMDMVSSVKVMLDYMYSYIMINYNGEHLDEALRVFRLIRWFGEKSILNNAQYKISYAYEDLKSNLQTGVCRINNETKNMFIDPQLKVFSVTPESLSNDNAYVKFFVNNKLDTKITFSISFWSGYVNVYLNGELIDTITSSKAIVSYDIDATLTQNEIMIERPKVSNVNFCYIGNIVIKNGTFKNLEVTYDPDLKMGNLPLNDIVQKMILLANMYEDEGEVLKRFQEGNLGVSELYKSLQEYWELHHQDKIKGKRLTIKET